MENNIVKIAHKMNIDKHYIVKYNENYKRNMHARIHKTCMQI